MNGLAGIFCALSLALSSIYLFPSGLPQPSDAIWLLFIAAVWIGVIRGRLQVAFPRPVRIWLGLCSLVVLVSGYWFAVTADSEVIKPALFWIYNFVVGWTLIIFLRRGGQSAAAWIRVGVILGLIVSVVGVFFNLGSSIRSTGWFNNPNQLAYHSICLGGLLLVLDKGRLRFEPLTVAAYLSSAIGVLAASSIAGFGGWGLLLCGVALASGLRLRNLARVALLSTALIPLLISVSVFGNGAIAEGVKVRLERMGSKVEDASAERRLYRLVEHPDMLALGAGEGAYYRFGPNEFGEMHSSLGTLLFSYGVLGLSLFLAFLWSVIRRARPWVWLIVFAPLLYSLTHMGLRFTVFWLLLVAVHELGERRLAHSGKRYGVVNYE